ncbi:MAG: ribosomal protein S18-alanine N-acetyltransferase [Bacilli bacterium]
MRFKIRPMEIDDINHVVIGETKVFGNSLGFDMLYSELTLNPYANYFVLEINRKVKGYIGVWINENAEVINLYVDEKYQGMGFGKMLVEFAVQLCQMSNVEILSLEVRKSNVKAQSLYYKFGFEFSHYRNNYYEDGEDAIVMLKKFEV